MGESRKGQVERLLLHNFKSYKGTVTIGPFDSRLSCVIGPNGSGKSNTMEALSFVLGVGASDIRGSEVQDLIYNVTVKGKQNKEKNAWVLMEFKDEDDKTWKFQRSIQDGKKSTQYELNNKKVTWEAYNNQLKEFGILTHARNFLVFQGDVELVAQKSPKELTDLLEKVSGSDEFRAEYERRWKAKHKATEKMIAASEKKRGAGAEHKEFKQQKKEVEQYYDTLKQRAAQKREYSLFFLYHIEHGLNKYLDKVRSLGEEIKLHEDSKQQEQDKLDAKRAQMGELHKKQLKLIRSHRGVQDKLNTTSTQRDKLRISIEHKKEKIDECTELIKKSETATKENQKEIAKLQKDLQATTTDKDKMKQAYEELCNDRGTMTKAQHSKWLELKAVAQTKTVTRRQELEQLTRSQEMEDVQLQLIKQKEAALTNHKEKVEEQAEQLQERHEALRKTVQKAEEQKAKVEEEHTNLVRQIEEHGEEYAKYEQKLREVADVLTMMRAERDESEKERKMAAAVTQMKGMFPGVKGQMFDLCKIVPDKYKLAVTVGMGKNFDAIVVDNADTGRQCIEYLKEQRLPPMTFIPLATITPSAVPERLRRIGGTCSPLIDFIQHEKQYQPAIQYAVGATLVCDKMAEAKMVAFAKKDNERHKVVTLDGSIVYKNGCIGGGKLSVEKRAKKWEQAAYEKKKKERENLLEKLSGLPNVANLKQQEYHLAQQLAQVESQVTNQKRDLSNGERKLEGKHKELDQLAKELKTTMQPAKERENNVKQIEKEMQKVQKKISDTEREVFVEFAKEVDIDNVQDYEQQKRKDKEEFEQNLSKHEVLISKLENQLNFHNKSLKKVDAKHKERKQQLEKEVKEAQQRMDKLEKEQEKLTEEVDEMKTGTAENKSRMAKIDKEMKELKAELGVEHENWMQVNKERHAANVLVDKARKQRLGVLRKCKVDQIEVPIRSATDPDAIRELERKKKAGKKRKKLAQKRKRGETQSEGEDEDAEEDDLVAISEPIGIKQLDEPTPEQDITTQVPPADDNAFVVNFHELPDRMKRKAGSDKEWKRQAEKYEHKVQELTEQAERLAPNMKSLERMKGASGVYDETSKDFEHAREDQRDAMAAFEDIKEKRKSKFEQLFSTLGDMLSTIYKGLTKDEKSSHAGGTAYLTFENLDEPYAGGTKFTVMPPHKRHHEIDALSGGERTIAALALLFAIQSVHPSPFFVLDEIDAALDAGNVRKVQRFVLDRSNKETQFIVISLKPQFFKEARALFGIYKDNESNSSKCLSWKMDFGDEDDSSVSDEGAD